MKFATTDVLNMIRKSWGPDTALNPEAWSPECPATGQCSVSALLIDDIYDFPVQRGIATLPDGSTKSYYWNDGVDLTLRQFPLGTTTALRDGPQGYDARVYLLSNPDVARRYETLRKRFEAIALQTSEVDA